MEGSFWSRRSTRTGIIAVVVLILASGAYFWYIRATSTAATRAAAIPNAMESRHMVKASASTPVKPGAAPHAMRKQPAKEAGEHKD